MDGQKGRIAVGVTPLRIALAITLTQASIAWERFWGLAWKAISVCGLLGALALSGLLPMLSLGFHLATLLLFGVGIAAAASPMRHFRLPNRRDAIRRLEKDSDRPHRPLTALFDQPAEKQGDQTLWLKHQRRAFKSLKNLTPLPPRSPVPPKDQYALRFSVLLCLIIGLVVGWKNPGERLANALFPGFGTAGSAGRLSIEAWITPPAYTGYLPTFLLLDHPPAPLVPAKIPQGSTIKVHLANIGDAPTLSIGGNTLETRKIGGAHFTAEGIINDGNRLTIRAGAHALLTWSFDIIHDQPPTIRLIAKPSTHPATQELSLHYHAADDYAVEFVTMSLRSSDDSQSAPIEFAIATPGGRSSDLQFRRDLTDHPWAGRDVEMTLKAVDGIGQEGRSPPQRVTLPEREFSHPIARRLVKARRRLNIPGPTRLDVASDLGILAGRPESFGHDSVVILGLSVAESRLIYNADRASLDSVRALLWDMAIRLDKGARLLAQRNLTNAEEALREALQQGADQEILERLMDEMAEAMKRFLNEITAGMTPETIPNITLPDGMEIIGRDELEEIINSARELMRRGDIKGAQQLIAQLKEMLENINIEKPRNLDEALAESKQILENLDSLEKEQRKHLDDTFKRFNAPADAPPPTTDGAQEQEALRQKLNKLMKRIQAFSGEFPENLNKADSAMNWARDTLQRQRLDLAHQHQGEALDRLRQARRETTKLLGQTLSQKGLQTFTKPGQQRNGPDPFGRGRAGMRGNILGKGPELPGQPTLERAKIILDELRRRLNDPTRRELERDYLERLLKMY